MHPGRSGGGDRALSGTLLCTRHSAPGAVITSLMSGGHQVCPRAPLPPRQHTVAGRPRQDSDPIPQPGSQGQTLVCLPLLPHRAAVRLGTGPLIPRGQSSLAGRDTGVGSHLTMGPQQCFREDGQHRPPQHWLLCPFHNLLLFEVSALGTSWTAGAISANIPTYTGAGGGPHRKESLLNCLMWKQMTTQALEP